MTPTIHRSTSRRSSAAVMAAIAALAGWPLPAAAQDAQAPSAPTTLPTPAVPSPEAPANAPRFPGPPWATDKPGPEKPSASLTVTAPAVAAAGAALRAAETGEPPWITDGPGAPGSTSSAGTATTTVNTTTGPKTDAPTPPGSPASEQVPPPRAVVMLAGPPGTLWIHAPDTAAWSSAPAAGVLPEGDSLKTAAGARGVLRSGPAVTTVAGGSELQLVDAASVGPTMVLAQGEAYIEVTSAPGSGARVITPRGVVTLEGPGRFSVHAGDILHPTVIKTFAGVVHVEHDGSTDDAAAGKGLRLTGRDPGQFVIGVDSTAPDSFEAVLEAAHPNDMANGYGPASLPPLRPAPAPVRRVATAGLYTQGDAVADALTTAYAKGWRPPGQQQPAVVWAAPPPQVQFVQPAPVQFVQPVWVPPVVVSPSWVSPVAPVVGATLSLAAGLAIGLSQPRWGWGWNNGWRSAGWNNGWRGGSWNNGWRGGGWSTGWRR